MTRQYMSFTQVAEYIGVTTGALGNIKLPEPDVRIGSTRGWSKATISKWAQNRPHAGRPRKS